MALGLCLVRAAVTVAVAGTHFTLGWMHSVEKTRWEEDWRVTRAGLVIDEARIHGSGAGMEPPDGAVLRDGVWHYKPKLPPLPSLVLAASEFTPDHTLCAGNRCQPLQRWIAGDGPVRLEPCDAHRAPRHR